MQLLHYKGNPITKRDCLTLELIARYGFTIAPLVQINTYDMPYRRKINITCYKHLSNLVSKGLIVCERKCVDHEVHGDKIMPINLNIYIFNIRNKNVLNFLLNANIISKENLPAFEMLDIFNSPTKYSDLITFYRYLAKCTNTTQSELTQFETYFSQFRNFVIHSYGYNFIYSKKITLILNIHLKDCDELKKVKHNLKWINPYETAVHYIYSDTTEHLDISSLNKNHFNIFKIRYNVLHKIFY